MRQSVKSIFKINMTSLVAAMFCLVWFIQAAYLPSNIYVCVKILRVILGGIITIRFMLNNNIKKWSEYLPLPIIALVIVMVISSMNSNRSISQLVTVLGYFFGYISVFVIFCEKKVFTSNKVMNGIAWMIKAFVVLDFINIIFIPEGIWKNDSGNVAIYINGGKFSVYYLVLLFLIIMCFEDIYRHKKIMSAKNRIFFLAAIVVEVRSNCMSGVLGIGILFLIIWYYCNKKKLFFKRKKRTWMVPLFLLLFAILVYLVLFVRIQERFSWFQYIMYDVLQKNLSLDGRYRVYSRLFGLMRDNWLLGYGIGNDVIYSKLVIQNAQNGFFEILLNYGLAGLVSLIWFIITFYKKLLKLADNRLVRGMIMAILIVYLYFAIFEVPFGIYFYLTCGILQYYVMLTKVSETAILKV